MAPSSVSSLSACALALALFTGVDAQDDRTDAEQEIEFASQSMTFDGQRNLFELETPEIKQGDLRLYAARALATDIEFETGSEWRFTGRVRLEIGTAVIEAERAVFTFQDKQLARGELEGGAFSDIDATAARNVTGQAQHMSYDYIARTLRMTGNPAWVRKNKIEMQGCDLIYDFTAERMTSGSADCADQFRMRTLPDSAEPATAPAPAQ